MNASSRDASRTDSSMADSWTTVHLHRLLKTPTCTLGVLSYQDARLAFTLEDPVRENRKLAGRTAIPAGTYQLFWRTDGTRGPRYRKRFGTPGVLQLRDVLFFEGIQIHCGNDVDDTRGCILVGRSVPSACADPLTIGESVPALEHVHSVLGPLLAEHAGREGPAVYLQVQ